MPKQPVLAPRSFALFDAYKQAINHALDDCCQGLSKLFEGVILPPIAEQALEFISEYTLRPGKRVRGALAAMAYDNLRGMELSENGLKLATAMELVQSYLLIVDDVTDRSDLRRGEPTVHRLYEAKYKDQISERDAEQFAFYTGMIAGHIANLVLLGTDETPEHVNAAFRYIHKNIVTAGFGQLDDIMQEITRGAVTNDIIRKYSLKTSYYTFVGPLQAGMALAGVDDKGAFDSVAAFGIPAGVAFQAHDDYLGVFGGTETGKPNTDDVREGKLTILMQFALAHGTPAQTAELTRYLGNPGIGEREMEAVRTILDESGATMEARQTTERYARQATQALARVPIWDETFKSQLAELVTYSISRKS